MIKISHSLETSITFPLYVLYVLLWEPMAAQTLTISRSASDNIRTIIEKTESVYVQKFQCSISGTLSSGKFPKTLANKREALRAYFASGFIDQ